VVQGDGRYRKLQIGGSKVHFQTLKEIGFPLTLLFLFVRTFHVAPQTGSSRLDALALLLRCQRGAGSLGRSSRTQAK
jgi:hypothetical protein